MRDEEDAENYEQVSCTHDVLQSRHCTVAMGTNCHLINANHEFSRFTSDQRCHAQRMNVTPNRAALNAAIRST
eukprot:COSAG02_NODE_1322_length_13259_cov_71.269985_4_plen_73_part_00